MQQEAYSFLQEVRHVSIWSAEVGPNPGHRHVNDSTLQVLHGEEDFIVDRSLQEGFFVGVGKSLGWSKLFVHACSLICRRW